MLVNSDNGTYNNNSIVGTGEIAIQQFSVGDVLKLSNVSAKLSTYSGEIELQVNDYSKVDIITDIFIFRHGMKDIIRHIFGMGSRESQT